MNLFNLPLTLGKILLMEPVDRQLSYSVLVFKKAGLDENINQAWKIQLLQVFFKTICYFTEGLKKIFSFYFLSV